MKFQIYKFFLISLLLFMLLPFALYSSSKREFYEDFFRDDVDDILSNMTLKEKIGQILMFGFKKYELDEDYRKWIMEGELGNIKIFLRNVKSKEQLIDLISDISIYTDNTRLRIPPFIATDVEGGMVNHIRYDGIKLSPSPALVGASRDYELAKLTGRLIANNLLACGINMNFAPCFDVLTNPEDRVIDTRSYGSNPNYVYKMASLFINEHRKLGIVTVPKHFPGHGMTDFDSHIKAGIVNLDLIEIFNRHMLPYLFAAGDGMLDACMVSNVIYSSMDKHLSATLSPTIINGVLRNYFGFNGVVVTDDLEMKGAEEVAGGPVKAFTMSFKAGSDILLFAHSKDTHERIINEAQGLFNNGFLSKYQLDEKVRRVLLLKKRYLKIFYRMKEDRGNNDELLDITNRAVESRIDEGITLLLNRTGYSTKDFFKKLKDRGAKGIIISPSENFTAVSKRYVPNWKVVDAGYLHKNRKNKKRLNGFIKNVRQYNFALIGFSSKRHIQWIKLFDKYKIPYALFIVDNPLIAIKYMNGAQLAVTSYGYFLPSIDSLFRSVFDKGDFNAAFPYRFGKNR